MVDLIDIEADAGLQAVVGLGDRHHAGPQAADRQRGVPRIWRIVVHARDQLDELGQVVGRSDLERLLRDHRQRGRHGLRLLPTQARGHHQRFDTHHARVRRRVRRPGARRQRRHPRASQQRALHVLRYPKHVPLQLQANILCRAVYRESASWQGATSARRTRTA